MDIEYQTTPPKKTRRNNQLFSTPNQKTIPKDTQTPKKSRVTFESPSRENNNKAMTTPPKHSYQKSKKKTKNSSGSPTTPYKSPADELMDDCENEDQTIHIITPFYLPRLEADYKFIRYLGLGNFSRVALYESRLTNQQFAIKSTQLSLMSVNQVQALGTLSSKFSQNSRHIVKYYHSWIEQQKIYIVMEYCESSMKQIYQFMKLEGKIIPQEKLKEMLKQALIGLKTMHDCNMVHLDIKPDNLLLKQGDVKIADLGLCRITRIKKWSDLDQGDTRYLAKEVLNYDASVDLTKADIYSLGMSIFQGAILEDLPNNGEQWLSIRDEGINLRDIPQMQNYSQEFQEIISQMIQPNWQHRPSCEQLLTKYFGDVKNKRLSRFLRVGGKSARKQEGSL